MLKPNQSLNVNNSSSQTRIAHQTSFNNESLSHESEFTTDKEEVMSFAKELVNLAAKLQNGIWKLQETKLVQDMFSSDIAEAEMGMSSIALTLSDVFGTAYMEAIREKGGEL